MSPVLTRAQRTRIELAVEKLLALLDAIDGDENLEDGHDAELEDEHGREDSLDCGRTEHGIADADALHDVMEGANA